MISGYRLEAQVHRGRRSNVARAVRAASGDRVVLKWSAGESLPDMRARAWREFEIAAPIHSRHVVAYLGVEPFDNRAALVQEAFGDTSLRDLLARGRLPLEKGLQIGLQIAAGLVDIHAQGVTHRSIHPGNIVVDTATWTAKIVDFSEASLLTHRPDPARHLNERAIPLPYISPEQTGRMNRTVDYRTDFYSLGATLYHVLVGHPPFEISDPLALVHAHLAVPPRDLWQLDPHIPKQVSKVVGKLLQKNAEARYQSAAGITQDLEECLAQYRETGSVTEFALGRYDAPERFQIPERLYGRDAEREELLQAFARAAQGEKLWLLVSGYSGIGKSCLVNEVHKPIVERRGRFAAGKFDPLHRHEPYFALGQALTQLCRSLLSLPEEELGEWRERILKQVPRNAQLIVELVPILERIIGPQPSVPETGLLEVQHRFDLTLAAFLTAFAREGQPLVLFLDDLQWADPASLHAIDALMRASQPSHLLIIGAYRDNEVDASHPLAITLDELRLASVDVCVLHLGGLSQKEVTALIADAVRTTPSEARELAQLVYEKTSGNPFFVEEFLRTLDEEKLLSFSASQRRWVWNLAAIGALGITPNVVDLMVRKLERLPPATQQALRVGACIGNRFELGFLAEALDVPPVEMRARLAPAIRERLLVPLDPNYSIELVRDMGAKSSEVAEDSDTRRSTRAQEIEQSDHRYRFLHDRVQQAAYESTLEADRPELHLRLGRILRASARGAERTERVFEMTEQLNRGISLVTDQAERNEIAALNLEAGRRARRTTAYREGLAYFQRGMALLSEDAWTEHYAVAYGLHFGYAECAYLAGLFAEAEECATAFLPKVRSAPEKAELQLVRIELATSRGEHTRTLQLGREALAELDHPVPSVPAPVAAAMAAAKLAILMAGKRAEDLPKLPVMTDPRLIAVAKILGKITYSANAADQMLGIWAVHESVSLTIKHGVTTESAIGCLVYGAFLIGFRRDFAQALAFGRFALSLADRDDGFALRCSTYTLFALFMNAYAENHLRTSIPILESAVEVGLESGDLFYTAQASKSLTELRIWLGDPVGLLLQDLELRERSIRSFRSEQVTLEQSIFRQCLRCLHGETQGPASLSTGDRAESDIFAEAQAISAKGTRGLLLIIKTILHTLFGQPREAVRILLEHDRMIETSNVALIRLTEYGFFACLALVEGLRDRELDRRAVRRMLRSKKRLLARWAESAPMNFQHRYQLVLAELAEFEGRVETATFLYNEAIQGAEANGYSHHAALAAELAARAYRRRARSQIARTYLESARAGYLRWGALGKVRQLEDDHPELAREAEAAAPPLSLDTVSVVRASQALSSEIALAALLEKIMRVIVQTSGASRGVLLAADDGSLRIEAHLDAQRSARLVPANADEDMANLVSEAIVRYTLRTGEDVVLSDAAQRGDFASDPYVIAHHAKSVLCMALRHRDQIAGVLFLENDLSSGVFTEQRLEVLHLLLSQAAISLENARLYDSTQHLNLALKQREAMLRDFFEGMPVGVYVVDAKGRPVVTNKRAVEISGKPFEPSLNLSVAEVAETYQVYLAGTDQTYPVERSPLARALQGETSMIDDAEFRLPDRTVPVAAWGTPICDEQGAVRYAILAFQDISEQRAAETARTSLEAQLHQAQRLESIGRLAGGVAHDFNNLLTPILAYSELLARAMPPGSTARAQVTQIRDAAAQAADLTKQLLAFGRQQAIEPQVIDLNEEVRRFEKILRRLVRENVSFDLRLGQNVGRISADPSQIRRVIMNLAINGADAMPDGGQLVLETESVIRGSTSDAHREHGPSGACVVLRVRDSGHGMDADTLDRIFEPFFTTKAPGKGTGLGLPTVHGIVAQHGGELSVHSEIGKGTTFEVILPRVDDPGEQITAATSAMDDKPKGKGETVLVVEDDSAVRSVVADILRCDGYRVLAVGDPGDALVLAHQLGQTLDLLISDIIMPGMNGRELYRALTRERPLLKALFVSGYSEDMVSAKGTLDDGTVLLPKPFAVDALRARVRELLSADSESHGEDDTGE
ncbi:MAG: AAA family ATPase [Myxococcales bacterium]